MQQTLIYFFIIVLTNTGVHVAFWDGMIASPIRIEVANFLDKYLGKALSKVIQKPLWDCLPCMSSVWGTLWLLIDGYPIESPQNLIRSLLVICGMSVIIDSLLPNVNSNPDKIKE
jgi:hypothetical protein